MAEPTVERFGEDRLIAQLLRNVSAGKRVLVGHGDDCAVIGSRREQTWLLLKTDCVVESIHFTADASPRRIGWKAMARALSDIAAMGGTPDHALVTVALSPATPVARIKAVYSGLSQAATRFGAGIVGGETSRSPGPMFISIALTGHVERERCILRSGGKPGDLLYVTGELGGSVGGRHLTFVPRIAEGRWLSAHCPPSAMMDLSDGLGADLPRLARASACGFTLDHRAVPRPRGISTEQAISDGEDYELLFAVAPSRAAKLESGWRRRFPKLSLSRIGCLTRRPTTRETSLRGYDHFAQPP